MRHPHGLLQVAGAGQPFPDAASQVAQNVSTGGADPPHNAGEAGLWDDDSVIAEIHDRAKLGEPSQATETFAEPREKKT